MFGENSRGLNISTVRIPYSLRIQVCPKEGIIPTFLLKGWDWNPKHPIRSGGIKGWMSLSQYKELRPDPGTCEDRLRFA